MTSKRDKFVGKIVSVDEVYKELGHPDTWADNEVMVGIINNKPRNPKIRPAGEVTEKIGMLAYVTKNTAKEGLKYLVDPECIEILFADRMNIVYWLEDNGFPGAALELKKEIDKIG